LVDQKTYGDHEWMVGEVVAVRFSEQAFALDECLDIAEVNPTFYLGSERYATTQECDVQHLDRHVYGKQQKG